MLGQLSAGWRGRRVLLVGGENGLCGAMKAMLTEIGTRTVCTDLNADAQTLCRALEKGRTSAVFLLEEPKRGAMSERIAALLNVMMETREAGVPIFVMLSEMRSSPVQTAALGVSRGLLGDPVRTIVLRYRAENRAQEILYGALWLGARALEKAEFSGAFCLEDLRE